MSPDLFLRSVELSTTRKPTEGIQLASVVTSVFDGSGNLAGSTFRSLEQPCSKPSMPDDVRVEWAPWRLAQSQFRYRGEPNVIDLGEL
jgi:hypothetical protein